MNSFFTGQVIVCFKPPRDGLWKSRTVIGKPIRTTGPKQDEICIIRRLDTTGRGLLLDRYTSMPRLEDGTEAGFLYTSFRPLVEYKTDISALKALLVPVVAAEQGLADPLPAQRISQP